MPFLSAPAPHCRKGRAPEPPRSYALLSAPPASRTPIGRATTRTTPGAALASAVLALVSGLLVATPAQAIDYPTWADVEAAKGDTAAAAAQVDRITSLISDLQTQVAAAQQLAQQRGDEHFAAQQAFDLASDHAKELDGKASASAAEADAASQQAGLLAAQLYRSTGTDLSVNIFLDQKAGQADQLLSKIGNMTKLVERSSAIYEQASAARNTASSLADQAAVAQTERERLRVAAEQKLAEATAAQQASEAALAEQQQQSVVLEQQLAALRDTESKTVADYEAGVAAREAERQRKLAEEAAAREAAAQAERERVAAARASSASSGGYSAPSGGGASTAVSDSGWVRPRAAASRAPTARAAASPPVEARPPRSTAAPTWPAAAASRSSPPTAEQ